MSKSIIEYTVPVGTTNVGWLLSTMKRNAFASYLILQRPTSGGIFFRENREVSRAKLRKDV